MNRFAAFFSNHRLVLVAFVVAMTTAAALGMLRLTLDDQPRNLFRSDGPEQREVETLFADFGSDDNDCIIVVECEEMFSPDAIRFLSRLVRGARDLEGVDHVTSMLDAVTVETGLRVRPLVPPANSDAASFRQAEAAALAHPLVAGQLLSEDGGTTLIVVNLAGESLKIGQIAPIVEGLQSLIDAATADAAGIRARITGIPPLRVEIIQTVREDQVKFFLIGTLLGIGLATLLFRRPAAVVVAALPPMIGATWTLGALGWAGEPINVINTVLPTLVVVIGFTDAVHLTVDIRRNRAAGIGRVEASALAIRHLGLACGLTSLTTSIGFASLSVASVDVIRRFGLACATGTALTFLAVLILVPLFATLIPTRWIVDVSHEQHGLERRLWLARLIAPILAFPRTIATFGVAITLTMVALSFQLHPDNQITETVPSGKESAKALRHCDEVFGGILFLYVVVQWPEETTFATPEVVGILGEIHDAIEQTDGATGALSIRNVLDILPGSSDAPEPRAALLPLLPEKVLSRFVHVGHRRAIVTAHVRDVGVAANKVTFEDLEVRLEQVRARHPGFSVALTGTAVIAGRNLSLMIVDLARSLGIAAVVIFVVITVAFRSLRLGLISVIPNVFPLATTAALLVFMGIPLQITSVIVFSVCLGIAVDDTIHVLTRYRRERAEGHSVHVSIERTFVVVGVALLTTTLVLLAGFGSLIFSQVPAIRLYAILSCVAIAAALVGDLLILPALLKTFVSNGRVAAHETSCDSSD